MSTAKDVDGGHSVIPLGPEGSYLVRLTEGNESRPATPTQVAEATALAEHAAATAEATALAGQVVEVAESAAADSAVAVKALHAKVGTALGGVKSELQQEQQALHEHMKEL